MAEVHYAPCHVFTVPEWENHQNDKEDGLVTVVVLGGNL